MQYNIFVNQYAIIKNKFKIDLLDAVIIDYMRKLCASSSKAIEIKREDGYTWFNYQHMINELPLAGIKINTLKNHNIKRIKDTGLFDFKLKKIKDGSMIYIKPTPKCDLLDREQTLQ
jgi:hypothetical protein